MFACIGNLSLPIVTNNPSVQCYGVEINSEAFSFLNRNLVENQVEERYFPILGDNRNKTPIRIATRVLMGYFGIDNSQFCKAKDAIKENGWIHYHELVERGLVEQVKQKIEGLTKTVNSEVTIEKTRFVKKFSPRLVHICFDLFVNK